jgi:hypothetical protein
MREADIHLVTPFALVSDRVSIDQPGQRPRQAEHSLRTALYFIQGDGACS